MNINYLEERNQIKKDALKFSIFSIIIIGIILIIALTGMVLQYSISIFDILNAYFLVKPVPYWSVILLCLIFSGVYPYFSYRYYTIKSLDKYLSDQG